MNLNMIITGTVNTPLTTAPQQSAFAGFSLVKFGARPDTAITDKMRLPAFGSRASPYRPFVFLADRMRGRSCKYRTVSRPVPIQCLSSRPHATSRRLL